MARDDDLDADFALFEEEIAADLKAGAEAQAKVERTRDVVKKVPGQLAAQGNSVKSHVVTAPPGPALLPSSVITSVEPNSDAAVTPGEAQPTPQMPDWQRELLQRDYQRMQASQALKKSAAVGTSAADKSGESTDKTQASAAVNVPLGRWVWTGVQWAWDATAMPLIEKLHAPSVTADAETAAPAENERKKTNTGYARAAAGVAWVDNTLDEWPEDDFRIFVGDMAPDATNEELTDAFKKYPSFNMSRIVMDKLSGECKGYGFVSFAKGEDMVSA
jgi:hypothetical protein